MPLDVRHTKVSTVADNGDETLVQGPDWNAAHQLLQGPLALLGRADSATGQHPTVEVPISALPLLPLTGGTLTGDLTIAHAGDVYMIIHSTDVSSGRPTLALTKHGVTEATIQVDGALAGRVYYQALGAGGLHQFFADGISAALITSTNAQFPGDVIGAATWSVAAANALHYFDVTGNPANVKLWQTGMIDVAGALHLRALNDDTSLQAEAVVNRDGSISVVAPAATDSSTKVPTTAWVQANVAKKIGPYNIGQALNINLNVLGDTAITVSMPPGARGFRLQTFWLFGESGAFGTAQIGLWTGAGRTGTNLAAQVVTPITAAGLNTAGAIAAVTISAAATSTVVNVATIFFNVSVAQGAASVASTYLIAEPIY